MDACMHAWRFFFSPPPPRLGTRHEDHTGHTPPPRPALRLPEDQGSGARDGCRVQRGRRGHRRQWAEGRSFGWVDIISLGRPRKRGKEATAPRVLPGHSLAPRHTYQGQGGRLLEGVGGGVGCVWGGGGPLRADRRTTRRRRPMPHPAPAPTVHTKSCATHAHPSTPLVALPRARDSALLAPHAPPLGRGLYVHLSTRRSSPARARTLHKRKEEARSTRPPRRHAINACIFITPAPACGQWKWRMRFLNWRTYGKCGRQGIIRHTYLEPRLCLAHETSVPAVGHQLAHHRDVGSPLSQTSLGDRSRRPTACFRRKVSLFACAAPGVSDPVHSFLRRIGGTMNAKQLWSSG